MWKVVRQNDADVMSRFMQLKKGGCVLLREAFRGEGECYISLKRGGKEERIGPQKTQVNKGGKIMFIYPTTQPDIIKFTIMSRSNKIYAKLEANQPLSRPPPILLLLICLARLPSPCTCVVGGLTSSCKNSKASLKMRIKEKNAKGHFNKHTRCEAPVHWSKYTTC